MLKHSRPFTTTAIIITLLNHSCITVIIIPPYIHITIYILLCVLRSLRIAAPTGPAICELPSILRLKLPVLCSFYKAGGFCVSAKFWGGVIAMILMIRYDTAAKPYLTRYANIATLIELFFTNKIAHFKLPENKFQYCIVFDFFIPV